MSMDHLTVEPFAVRAAQRDQTFGTVQPGVTVWFMPGEDEAAEAFYEEVLALVKSYRR